ncbi:MULTISPECIES: helix-turn-helix transcriptional regulator [Siminovitchia]|uniref:Helix-turn-helix transcriptional regulator n=1 Tax=Siminovitchia sediminis TaxID=1274353 RepID=A0ABW4KKF8_9BACI|nr:helix-turn-helix transcriptional regulator [Siminovitchia fortis]
MKPVKRLWLCKMRKNSGLTQWQVAKDLEIGRSTYAKAELGYAVSVDTAKRIAQLFGVSWVLFFNEDCSVSEQLETIRNIK